MALAGCWHISLFVIHVICLLVTFIVGISLNGTEKKVYTSLQVMNAIRTDKNVVTFPDFGDVTEEEKAIMNVRTCLLVCCAICFVITIMIAVNIYCFMAVILSPDSTAMTTLPGLAAIRSKMEEEVQGAELPAEGEAQPPGLEVAEEGLSAAEGDQSEMQAGEESAAPESEKQGEESAAPDAPETGESAAQDTESTTPA